MKELEGHTAGGKELQSRRKILKKHVRQLSNNPNNDPGGAHLATESMATFF